MSLTRKPIRLLVVGDHEVVPVGLQTVIHNNQGTMAGYYRRRRGRIKAAARWAATRFKPDVVLMNVRLPDGSA